MKRVLAVLAVGTLLFAAAEARAQEQQPVEPAHGALEPGATADDHGIDLPIPASHPARRYPASHDFPSGPGIGERLPEFSIPNQHGDMVDFHVDRDDSKSVVVFYRSAVW